MDIATVVFQAVILGAVIVIGFAVAGGWGMGGKR